MSKKVISEIKANKQEYQYEEHEVYGHLIQFRIRKPKVKDVVKFSDNYPRAFAMVTGYQEPDVTQPESVLEALQGVEDVMGLLKKLILITTEYRVGDKGEWTAFAEESDEVLTPDDLGGEVVTALGTTIFRRLTQVFS